LRPEYLLNVEIGHQLSKVPAHSVWLESTLKGIRRKHAGGKVRKKAGDTKRFDITVWHREKVRAVIELKRVNTSRGAHDTIMRDCKKIVMALNAGIGLKVGYLLIHSQAPNSQERKSVMEDLEKRFRAYQHRTLEKQAKLKVTRINVQGRNMKRRTGCDVEGPYWWNFALIRLEQRRL
jgi:hypothetical protein